MPSRKPPSFDLEKMLSYRVSMLFGRLSVGTSRQLVGSFDLALREWRVLALLAKLTGELDVAEACAQRADVVAGRVAPAADPVVEVPAPEGAPAKPAA